MRRRPGRKAGCLLVLGVIVLAAGAGVVWSAPFSHFNPVSGLYAYDPRREQPAAWVFADRPEAVVSRYVQEQIAQQGTFPADSQNVAGYEPVYTAAYVYTDWQTGVVVTMRLTYVDGHTQDERFHLHSTSSGGVTVGQFDLSRNAHFEPVAGCKPSSGHDWDCGP